MQSFQHGILAIKQNRSDDFHQVLDSLGYDFQVGSSLSNKEKL
jgi:hypothetical protein